MPAQKPNRKMPRAQENWWAPVLGYWDQAMKTLFGATGHWQGFSSIARTNYELGMKHLRLGNLRDAVFRFRFVTWLQPGYAQAWYQLGCSYLAQGKKLLAGRVLKRALKLKPDYAEASYMLAVCGGKQTPAHLLPTTMPLSLARNHFNALAASYEREQVDTYGYQGHTLLCAAIRACLQAERVDYVVAELGVGTGLCGPLLRDAAASLTGADISANMLQAAKTLQDAEGKPIYDQLQLRELHAFVRELPASSVDVIFAANVFSYIGQLDALFPLVALALKPGGLFAFTADSTEEQGYRFDPEQGRFAFSADYLRTLASQAGLHEIRLETAELFAHSQGWIAIFAK